jgi:ATP-dependent protease ClpP protease subunit
MSSSKLSWIKNDTSASDDKKLLIHSYNNEIIFTSEINELSIYELIKNFDETITRLKSNCVSSMSTNNEKITIRLYIDSPGGNLKDCFKFIDYIKIIKNIHNIHLITIGIGEIASAGTLIHIIGDERYITENSEVMIHELYSGTSCKYTEFKSYMKTLEDAHNKLLKIYLTYNKKITKDELELLLKNETYFTAEEYINLGFADSIF